MQTGKGQAFGRNREAIRRFEKCFNTNYLTLGQDLISQHSRRRFMAQKDIGASLISCGKAFPKNNENCCRLAVKSILRLLQEENACGKQGTTLDMEIKDGKDYLEEVKRLIAEYTQRLGRNLSFQELDSELKDPARKYTPPQGELLVAVENGKVVGMVAYHRHSAIRCEMKRLYVRPEVRGLRLGEALVREIIAHARAAGYSEMVLDTIKPLKAAIGLYKKAGFEECEPYYNNPMDDVIYMNKYLQ